MELDVLKLHTTWNDAANSINTNFSKIQMAIASLGTGGGGLNEDELRAFLVVYLTQNGYATKDDIDNAISDIINGAPSTLDTLKEIADALAESDEIIVALNNAIGTKASKEELNEGLSSLANSKITISGVDVSLGGEITQQELRIGLGLETIIDWYNRVGVAFGKKGDGTYFVDGDFLANGQFAAAAVGAEGGGSVGAAYLADLYDVSLSSLLSGDILSWNGSEWVNIKQSSLVPDLSAYASKSFVSDALEGYLPLTGGTINGSLILNSPNSDYALHFQTGLGAGWIGFQANSERWFVTNRNWSADYTLLHTGNYSQYALPRSGGTISGNLTVDGYIVKSGHFFGVNNNDNAEWYVTDKNWQNTYTLIHSGNFSDYALPKSGGTISGILTINDLSSANPFIYFQANGSTRAGVGYYSDYGTYIYNAASGTILGIKDDGTPHYNMSTIIHSGNVGDYAITSSGEQSISGKKTIFEQYTDKWSIGGDMYNLTISRSGGWAGTLAYIANTYGGSTAKATISAYGDSGTINYMYLGLSNDYNGSNFRIYSDKVAFGDNTILHSGNIASQSVAYASNAGTLGGVSLNNGSNTPWGTIPMITEYGWMDVGRQFEFHYDNTTGSDYSTVLRCAGNYGNSVMLPSASGTLALTTDNVASATKLQTPRTIWGQSFDGTGNISGNLLMDGWITTPNGTAAILTSNDYLVLGQGLASAGKNTYLDGYEVNLRYGTSSTIGLTLNPSGNVLIGTTTDSGYKLDVSDSVRLRHHLVGEGYNGGASLYFGLRDSEALSIEGRDANGAWERHFLKIWRNGHVYIGPYTSDNGYMLDVAGTLRVSDTLTAQNGIVTNEITIGGIKLDVYNGALRVNGDIFSTGQFAASVAGEATGSSNIVLDYASIVNALGYTPANNNNLAQVAFTGSYADLSNKPTSLPASDVYSWAKASVKPTYSWSEIQSRPDVYTKQEVDDKLSDIGGGEGCNCDDSTSGLGDSMYLYELNGVSYDVPNGVNCVMVTENATLDFSNVIPLVPSRPCIMYLVKTDDYTLQVNFSSKIEAANSNGGLVSQFSVDGYTGMMLVWDTDYWKWHAYIQN